MFKIIKNITPMLINNNVRSQPVYNITRLCSTITEIKNIDESKLSGFAKAYEKHGAPIVEEPKEELTFAALFQNSKFVDVSFLVHFFMVFFCWFLIVLKTFSLVIQKVKLFQEEYFILSKMIYI